MSECIAVAGQSNAEYTGFSMAGRSSNMSFEELQQKTQVATNVPFVDVYPQTHVSLHDHGQLTTSFPKRETEYLSRRSSYDGKLPSASVMGKALVETDICVQSSIQELSLGTISTGTTGMHTTRMLSLRGTILLLIRYVCTWQTCS